MKNGGHHEGLWTEADRQRVAQMLLDGLSASGIGAIFGLTRNAVIGRVHRDEGLRPLMRQPSPSPFPHKARAVPPKPPKPPKPKKPGHTETRPAAPPAVTAQSIIPKLKPQRLIPLAETGTTRCKWPERYDPDVIGYYWCCGRETGGEHVYCAYHRHRARPGGGDG